MICAREECRAEFTPRTHNMKYCGSECCRLATNARMMRKYHERQAFLKGKKRMCIVCDTTRLSRYNPSDTCAACKMRLQNEINNNLINMLENVVA